tara:strand:+ start:1283 stop:1669 length:387 start_codon:yes stop_codon:yes gene_type:complete
MLTKILVTALVVFGCYLFIRFKRRQQTSSMRVIEVAAERPSLLGSPVRMLALGLCVLSLLASAVFLGYRWSDNRTLLQVRVISATSGEVVEYQAYKGDVEGRSFVTLYGQRVSIAASERMEIHEVKGY